MDQSVLNWPFNVFTRFGMFIFKIYPCLILVLVHIPFWNPNFVVSSFISKFQYYTEKVSRHSDETWSRCHKQITHSDWLKEVTWLNIKLDSVISVQGSYTALNKVLSISKQAKLNYLLLPGLGFLFLWSLQLILWIKVPIGHADTCSIGNNN